MTKIINLKAENIMRLKAVEITPDVHLNIIAGNNAQGKTSVLDSIVIAMGGKKSKTELPLRKGAETGKIRCELDDYIVTRTFTEKGDYLKVENKEGATFNSPQGILDKITGTLTFDPLEFTNMDSKKQLETLKQLVGLDFGEMELKKKELFDERTILNREIKSLDNQINAIQYEPSQYKEEISVSDLMKELKEQRESNDKYRLQLNNANKWESAIDGYEREIIDLKAKIQEIEDSIESAKRQRKEILDALELLHLYDTSKIEEQIQNAESINENLRKIKQKRELETRLKEKADIVKNLTKEIAGIDEEKERMLKEAKFPVPGLSFDEDGVLFEGIPFGQCSSAMQLLVSASMGIVTNPKFKVLLIRDGNRMDKEHLEILRNIAIENDYQIWLERVGEDEKCAIIIEDGMVKDAT